MLREMGVIQISERRIFLATVLLVLVSRGFPSALPPLPPASQGPACRYFKIQVVDRQTGRGVPLVELRTVNNVRYFTDSNAIVAFYEPGLMDRDVFFFVESHGYEFPKDGFGMRGTRLRTKPGESAVIKIERVNIAERLYRVTGQGIYRDSVLTGQAVPLKNPLLNGQVSGQDSVFTCLYQGRLFWMWGDTSRPSYPLGNFAMSGAVSDLPGHGGLDPAIGVDLKYYVGEDGFSRPLSPMKEPGLVWLDGLITVKDNEGQMRMVAKYARLKDLGDVRERGLVVFNDATESFEPLVRGEVEFLPYSASGHAFGVDVEGQRYYYFAVPFPMAVRMRVKAQWDDVIDANRYEVLTALATKKPGARRAPPGPGEPETPCHWVSFAELTANITWAKVPVIKALENEKEDTHLFDIESGKKISPHNGSVYFNEYRQRWIMIFVQQFGESSFLGEVWYAEADTPVGPWVYATKIVTHNKYSFYNPKQHPYFDQDGGRVIFFEGTYSYTFSGSAENATPRYDYNQIMYRVNLDDPRLALPVAVYEVQSGSGERDYLLRDGVETGSRWDQVKSIPFFAVEPARAHGDLVAVYAHKVPGKNGQTVSPQDTPHRCLTTECPDPSAKPLFYALASSGGTQENSSVAPLYEYRHTDTGQRQYCTEAQMHKEGWTRVENHLFRVWKAPTHSPLLDTTAKPTRSLFCVHGSSTNN